MDTGSNGGASGHPHHLSHTQDLWYTYDEMNRVLVSQGVNDAGQRTSARQYGRDVEHVSTIGLPPFGNPFVGYRAHNHYVEERYTYDGLGRLLTTEQQIDFNEFGTPSQSWQVMNSRQYDGAGILRGYSVAVYKDGKYQYTTQYTEEYRLGDIYQQTKESASSSTTVKKVKVPKSGAVERQYNVNGELVSITDTREDEQNCYFANNQSGQALTVVQGSYDGRGQAARALKDAVLRSDNSVEAQRFFFANGAYLASLERRVFSR